MTDITAPKWSDDPRERCRELTRLINAATAELVASGAKPSKHLNSRPKTSTAPRRRREPEPAVIADLNENTIVEVVGESGYFFFRGTAKNGDVNVYGGEKGHYAFRSFPADRICKSDVTAEMLRESRKAKAS